MLRIGIVGDMDRGAAGPRLRGATLAAPSTDCDAVVILAADEHAVERHLTAGKHVLLADVGGITSEYLGAWAALTDSGGPQLAIVNPERFLPTRELIRQQVASNLGEPGLLRIHRLATSLTPSHLPGDLDLAVWLMGRQPNVAWAQGKVGDLLQIHLGVPGGGMALISQAGGPAFADYCSLSLIASTGAAYADDQSNRQLHFANGAVHALRTSEHTQAMTAMIQAFVDALAAGTDFSASRTHWRGVLAVRDAVTNSLATERAFSVEGS